MNYIEELKKNDSIKRRILLAVLVLVTFIFQTTRGFFPSPFGIHACLLVPATVCIAMFEREFSGLFFGLAAGMMLEAVSPDSVCFYYLMRNNLVTALIFTFMFTLLLNSLYCLFFYVFDGIEITFVFYLKYYVFSAVYTTLFTPIFYLIVRLTVKKFK